MNVSPTALLTYQHLNFIWPYGDVRLNQVEMTQELGEHARLWITGRIQPDQEEAIISRASSTDEIELSYTDTHGQQHPLFMGQLYGVDIGHFHQELQVTIQVISHSFKLDTELKNRSFQQVNQQYVDIIDDVLADYSGSDKLDEAFGSRPTNQFIMQYQETDWIFLKRLASHAGAMLVPNITAHRIQIWIGIPEARRQVALEDVPFRMRRRIASYLNYAANGRANTSACDYTGYTFEWPEILQPGDEIKRSNLTYVITKRTGAMTSGVMTWSYECALPEGVTIAKTYNRTIIGAAIEGKILEVSRNQVRLHLDMDDQQDPTDAQWFPYSAEGNQVWYLMPEQGAQVKLYFPTADEDDALVIQSVRTTSSPAAPPPPASDTIQGAATETPAERHNRKMADPGVKSFANPQGKEVSLGNSELNISAQEGSLYISMNTDYGVSLQSTQNMWIQATGSLSLSAGSILLKGTDGLHLHTMTDTLDLEEGVNNLSSEILLQASVHQSYPEPLLSNFEQQVAELGIDAVLDQRTLTNEDSYAQGAKHDLLVIAKGLWNSVVDIGDIVLTGQNDENMRRTYSILNHGKEVAPLEERNATFKGIVDTVSYFRNTSMREMKNDALDHVKDTMELLMERERNKWLNPLTSTPEENYQAGQTAVQAAFAEFDLATMLIPGGQAFTAPMKFSRKLKPGKLKPGKFGERVGKQVGERAEKSGISAMLGRLGKKEGLLELAAGDGKLKTHAISIPNSPASLEDFLQSIAKKMNLGSGSLTPATAGGHWNFHGQGPDLHPTSKGSGDLSPERQRQKNALESGEYTGRSAEGTGKTALNYGDQYDKIGNKKVLKSDVEYTDGNGYKYSTDGNGRISNAQGQLKLGEGERNPYAQRTVGGTDRLPNDDGGHLIGNQFKGSGEIDNLVPQNSGINRSGGEWYKMEKDWANALKEGSSVKVDITPNYSGNSMRPDSFKINYWIDGEKFTKTIVNP
ncbi:DNA/RNA non-specific endonuclease [Paenibacillus durus]|uniref:DNA/RNA non-specific endonuclease n=1 Tax=Paenibacillus durus TaxID=44251 RepID=UPI00069498C8|nr:DNA/RNA non-specific endonuclease [Paenibacillus durus]